MKTGAMIDRIFLFIMMGVDDFSMGLRRDGYLFAARVCCILQLFRIFLST